MNTTPGSADTLLSGLASNGPWAAMAGFLLWQLLKAWQGDRQQLTDLLSSFKGALDSLKEAVEHLTNRLDAHEAARQRSEETK
jgi:hypothetical protein